RIAARGAMISSSTTLRMSKKRGSEKSCAITAVSVCQGGEMDVSQNSAYACVVDIRFVRRRYIGNTAAPETLATTGTHARQFLVFHAMQVRGATTKTP